MGDDRTYHVKDPDAVLDFGIKWGAWLETGETITDSAWTVPSGITKESDAISGGTAVIWLSGGTARTTYTLTNHITTSMNRQDDRRLHIKVKER